MTGAAGGPDPLVVMGAMAEWTRARVEGGEDTEERAGFRAVVDDFATWVVEERASRDYYSRWAAGQEQSAPPQRTVPEELGAGLGHVVRVLAARFSGLPGYRQEWAP